MPENSVLVVGSLNYDLFLFQDRLAAVGETLTADGMREAFGGKGGNQAVQAAKLGAPVAFLGAVGQDERGQAYQRVLEQEGIRAWLTPVEQPTGLGVVNVLPGGDVHATIVEGANGTVDADHVRAHQELFDGIGFLILQNEIPESGVRAAAELGRQAGATVVYNAAPARPWSHSIPCDYLIVNEEEARSMAEPGQAASGQWADLAHSLAGTGPSVIITLGARGAVACLGGEVVDLTPYPATAVDSTGAGDSFVGAFVAALREGRDARSAASLAGGVAAITTEGVGAQTSMPRQWR